MGGFHEVRVMQRLFYKRNYNKGFRNWCVDANTIAEGFADQDFEVRHYFRCMRIHKELFDALIQYRFESIEQNSGIGKDLYSNLVKLRKTPSPLTLENVLKSKSFDILVTDILQYKERSDGNLTVEYLKDVSTLLALVSAVREGCIERHLQAERKLIHLAFAYDHPDYSRYCTYQNTHLTYLKTTGHPAYDDSLKKGIGGPLTGDPFSSLHGDLHTELFNRETKSTCGPFRSGFSTSNEFVNNWVQTIHIHSELWTALRKMLKHKTSSKHKEMTPGGKSLHKKHVDNLKQKLIDYGVDPFSGGAPRNISTGVEIDEDVVNDVLRVPKVGENQFNKFVEDRFVKGAIGLFTLIKRNNSKTGIIKTKKIPKVQTIMKEDCHAFEVIAAKAVSLEEAFAYPITSVPLAIASSDNTLRQTDKSCFRNMLILESNAMEKKVPKNASWFIDGMAAVSTIKPKKVYEDWLQKLITYL